MIIDEVYSKRKLLYDQIREGLKLLQFSDVLLHNESLLRKYFVPDFDEFVGLENFLINGDEKHRGYFTKFVQEMDNAILLELCLSATGKREIPRKKIKISFEGEEIVHSSTCDSSITFPKFESYELFKTCAIASTEGEGIQFNSI